MVKKSNHVGFIRMLRGLAALIVIFFHWGCLFFINNNTAASISFSNVTSFKLLPFWIQIVKKLRFFDFGMLGVSIFFLISGFLAPRSLEKANKASSFLINRATRLYPLYFVCLIITTINLNLSAKLNGIEYPYGIKEFLVNLSLFRTWFWIPSIDMVNWTMECQVFFYIVCAAVLFIVRKNISDEHVMLFLFLFGTTLVFICSRALDTALETNMKLYVFLFCIDYFLAFMFIMLIGTCFYNYYSCKWDVKKFLRYLLFFCALTAYNFIEIFKDEAIRYIVSYGVGLMFFAIAFGCRKYLSNHHSKFIDYCADISFPLYLTHGVSGYALLSILIGKFGLNCYIALVIALIVFVGCASIIHFWIEVPIQKMFGYIINTKSTGAKEH